jgi:RNA polymerase sigma-70 factor, ECF subfamily
MELQSRKEVQPKERPLTETTASRQLFEEKALPLLQEIYASAMRLTRQKEGAEDLVSEVYSRAWKSFGQFQPGTNLRAWLYKILTNTYINHYRHKQREPVMVELDRPEDDEGSGGGMLYERLINRKEHPSENPEHVLSNRFLDRDMKKAIEELPEDFRMVVMLADIQNFSYQEIADMLDIPIGTVRSRLWRGRRLLQQILWKQAVEAGIVSPQEQPPA